MLTRSRLHAQRGQTLVEWAVFMPILIAAAFALIFFSRLGVLGERSQSAVRYGEMVSFRNGNPYTVSTVNAVIDEILHSNSSELGPLCLEPSGGSTATSAPTVPPIALGGPVALVTTSTTVTGGTTTTPAPQNTSVANRVAADTQAALVQAQVVASSSASPFPSAKPFWRPDNMLSSNCNPASVALQQGSFGVGNMPVSVQSVSVSSSLNIPSYLAPMLSNGETSAQMGFLNIATPNTLLACVPGLSIALSILNPATAGQRGPACPSLPATPSLTGG
jgi:hypothetical protein